MIGTRVIAYDTVDSTNNVLKSLADSLPSGSVAWATEQTAGRGRFGRYWHSPKGGLWFSVLFKHRTQSFEPHYYVVLFSVAIVRFLKRKFKINAGIKWPNDIYVGTKKLAGILVESVISGKNTVIIVGIGMNVNNEIPPDLKSKAVSLKELLGHDVDLSLVFDGIVSTANVLYLKYMIKDKKKYLVRIWKGYQLLTPGSRLWVRIGDEEEREATLVDITPNALTLDLGGEQRTLFSLEVLRWENTG
ncbi:MAG: BirA family transcriptional regulator [Thermotogota bacterium]|nr:BirA family transcriptional regulator [Thermotogota bacterium]MDK2864205.1 BirA family transcriptional regulator [Thermotogota bacterium]HCZ05636.1 biotin--[acetyl-CoA-carboxylase] ligase [Thermotogota bacterium]